MAHIGPIPGQTTPQVYLVNESDGRIIKAPRLGDNDYVRSKPGWRVVEGSELAELVEARKRLANPALARAAARPAPAFAPVKEK